MKYCENLNNTQLSFKSTPNLFQGNTLKKRKLYEEFLKKVPILGKLSN